MANRVTVYPSKGGDYLQFDAEEIWFVNEDSYGKASNVAPAWKEGNGVFINPANIVAVQVQEL